MELRVDLNAVVLAVTHGQPRVMTLSSADRAALPSGQLDPVGDATLELGLRRWVRQQTGLELGYVEQLYSFGDRDRGAGPDAGGRLLSIAYLALVREAAVAAELVADWRNVYDFLPWEDGRAGRASALTEALEAWAAGSRSTRQVRTRLAFGLHGSPWVGERVLERYELLYEAGLVSESNPAAPLESGQPMALDHRRMLATALARVRGKLGYRPVIFELLPTEFTLLSLQQAVEALAGVPVHKQNFRRLVEQGGLVEGTGQSLRARGRPAELFRFRREVLLERPTPGVGLPRLS